jgi:ankyrin repeat protein
LTYFGPLAAALYSNNTDIVPALLKAGADPLGSLYEIKDPKSSSSSNPVYSYRNTVFDHIVGRFATSGGSLEQVSPTFFANAVAVWKVVMSLPASKRPAIAPKLTSNLFAYFANGAMKDFKAELVKTGDNTLDFLPYAALAGNWEIVDLILKYNNMEIDDCFNGGRQNLLEWAILNLHAGAAQLLLEHGAAMPTVIVVYDGFGRKIESSYPLVWAARNNKPELVKVLLTFKADPNTGLPLFYTHNAPVVRKLLLEAGANTTALFPYDAGYSSGWNKKYLYGTLLSDAAYKNSTEAVKFWLEKGLDPNPAGSLQPLVAAVARGNPESVKQLLEKGANPGIFLDKDTLIVFDFSYDFSYDDFQNKPLIELARYLASNTSDPLKKSSANQIVKLLEKALAAGTP